ALGVLHRDRDRRDRRQRGRARRRDRDRVAREAADGDRDRPVLERGGGAAGDAGGGAALVAGAAGAAALVPPGRARGDGRRGRASGLAARRRTRPALGGLPARGRLRRRGVRLLRRRRPLTRRPEDLGRARERVGRPVELHDLAALVPNDAQGLSAFPARDDAVLVLALALEYRRLR